MLFKRNDRVSFTYDEPVFNGQGPLTWERVSGTGSIDSDGFSSQLVGTDYAYTIRLDDGTFVIVREFGVRKVQ